MNGEELYYLNKQKIESAFHQRKKGSYYDSSMHPSRLRLIASFVT